MIVSVDTRMCDSILHPFSQHSVFVQDYNIMMIFLALNWRSLTLKKVVRNIMYQSQYIYPSSFMVDYGYNTIVIVIKNFKW